MQVVFRCDASVDIGTGHVMRCLTLADALRQLGAHCLFVCREHPGNLNDLIRQRGHQLASLERSPQSAEALGEGPSAYAAWLGSTPEIDADQTLAAIGNLGMVDWFVVDHYALDLRWERRLRPACKNLMVIDDLADRRHDCDLLLDQNLGRTEADYANLLPPHCKRLIGPRFALLRPEFSEWRSYSLERRQDARLQHLLITMGGVDKDNVTGDVINALALDPLLGSLSITVVLGTTAPWLDQVRSQCANMVQKAEVLVGVNNMAQLMSESDLAIGAAGSTSWERCCLGLPSLMLVLAENQRHGAVAIADAGVAVQIESADQAGLATLELMQSKTESISKLRTMIESAQRITDGLGANQVAALMTSMEWPIQPVARRMETSDLPRVLSWRNDVSVRSFMLTQHEISPKEHNDWFERASVDPTRCLLIVEEGTTPLGFVQFSNARQNASADWGFYAAPDAKKGSGKKLGSAALDYAFNVLKVHKVCGQALETNAASIGFHLSLGFHQEGKLREQHHVSGSWLDLICFGLLDSEWPPLSTNAI